MILQISAFFGNLLTGLGGIATQAIRTAAPVALGIGQQFLQRELNRKLRTTQRRQVQGQAVAALNTPGISVSRVGGTIQPVGGRVQRSTFTPAATTPAQNPFGNIPLLPVGTTARRPLGLPLARIGPVVPFGFPQPSSFPVTPKVPAMANGTLMRLPGAPGEPRFAKDEFGRTIMFVPSPRPGEGFITVLGARQLGLTPTKPFWRFNRVEGQFEKIKSRRLNPFNFRAAKRAGRRIERTLDAVKELVRIERKMTSGKVRLKRTKRRKR